MKVAKNYCNMNAPENMKEITDLASQLLKENLEKLSSVNPILHQDNYKGWQCPICDRVYSPTTPMCFYCGNKEIANQQTSK